ncbi:hypothetical protein [Pseudoalteromonas rubra]|uniref:hypothetical protein n=1 Tax=Pseudoalteromonas rubra TaxID=43658 RepID=UPI00026C9023|nr:hypothetical protein [Pseudoalteromonas rubra]
MLKNIVVIMLCLLSFFAGSMWGKFNFITSNIFQTTKPIAVSTTNGIQGIIPEGTELHLHSSAHKRARYFLFIDVPESESELKVMPSKHDEYGGIKLLKSVVK